MRHCCKLVVMLYVDNYVEQPMQSNSFDNMISEHEVPGEPFAFLMLVSCNCLKFNRARKEYPYDNSGKSKRRLAETCPPPVQFKVKYLSIASILPRRYCIANINVYSARGSKPFKTILHTPFGGSEWTSKWDLCHQC